MPLILGANSVTGGYEVDNSLRFNSGSSDYLSRTPATTTNQKTYTISFWYKRMKSGANDGVVGANPAGGSFFSVNFAGTGTYADKLGIYWYDGSTDYGYFSDRVFRDFSAWYHIVIAVDTTQATVGDRVKMYVNGIQETLTAVYGAFTQNLDTYYNSNVIHYIGANAESGTPQLNGYLTEYYSIDGQALAPSDFGEFDSDSGIWKPIAYTGTYGTNGFYLEFKDSSALGDDTSGEGNNFTVNNLTSIDQSTDTPTNNFATLNPLDAGGGGSYAEGNLQFTSATTDLKASASSFALNNGNAGKWYWEVKMVSTTGSIYQIGTISSTSSYITHPYSQYNSLGQVFVNGSLITTVSTFTTGDIISASFDATTSEVKYYKNGSLETTQTITNSNNILMFAGSHSDSSGNTATYQFNFGNPPFTISSGNSDANGYGNFEYAVPSGYYALCTKNLAEYG
jgi:hypothetical protein